jgi:error-prone DNA polymerase
MTDALPPGNYVELHAHSAFSFLRAGSSVEALVARAADLGMGALALTDTMTVAGAVRFQVACAERRITPILGCELAVADPVFGDVAKPARLVVLAENPTGYARLCQILTDANLAIPDHPIVSFSDLAAEPEGLILLTGGRDGTLARLLLAGQRQTAAKTLARYRDVFGPERVYVETQYHLLPDTIWLLDGLAALAASTNLRLVATNGVRYATQDDYPLYDLLTCVRLGISVDTPHLERPRNDQQFLRAGADLATLFAPFPWGTGALVATREIAARCHISLLKANCVAPRIPLPEGVAPEAHLHALCAEGLVARYAATPEALLPESPQRRQMAHELNIIEKLDLVEFFLCVHTIMRAARDMGIRVSGRGSAASSIVAYLLHITGVDPLHHHLLFERFLNPDRVGMPDIDIDVQSDRREELIRWVEHTFSERQTAMVANVNTYRVRGALRDVAKALGFPLTLVNRLTKMLHHHTSRDALAEYRNELEQVVRASLANNDALLTRCLERLPQLLALTPRLVGLPRHLSLHNGGMVLSRDPLAKLLPVRVSANGIRALEIDKDDVERIGLIKFDILGLRTLGALEEALTLIEETTNSRPDIDHLAIDQPDPATMRLIRAGQTLAVFQIESPGQWHLLAQTRPETFDDLIVQTALFRPGPIQGGFVHPYIASRRQKQRAQEAHQQARRGESEIRQDRQDRHVEEACGGPGTTFSPQRDAVQTPWRNSQPPDPFWTEHPILGAILGESEGILLFQEQILEIANRYAGLSYAEADGFRRAMSHAREPEEMEMMRGRFLLGAATKGESSENANRVFNALANFVGYGFCRSHAAEFARTIYATAWLKAHYPAHYLAAFLSAQPAGFFPPHVVLEEARLLGIPLLGVDINRSEDRFSVERVGISPRRPEGRWAIRIGLRQVAHVGDELAKEVLWERRGDQMRGQNQRERPLVSLADVCQRLRPVGLTWQAAESLTLAGAFDGLSPRMDRRRRLWELHELWSLITPSGIAKNERNGKNGRQRGHAPPAQQLAFPWLLDEASPTLPTLPSLTLDERLALDYQMLGLSARAHPMSLRRRMLRRAGIRSVAELAAIGEGRVVRVAGWTISAQRPPTANGMGFLVLEDESGRLPVALPPRLAAQMHRIIRDAREVVVVGHVERVRWYRALLATDLQALSLVT